MNDMHHDTNIDIEDKIGEVMNDITFRELVEQLTGCSFDQVYRNYLLHGAKDEKCNME